MNEETIHPDGTFMEWTKPCPECGNDTLIEYRRVNQHVGAYCIFCDKWLGWCEQWTGKKWDKHIKERAFYTCERCGKLLSGREAQAHHKLPQWFMPELKYDINNGICLCKECHKQIHGNGGTIKEKEQINA